MLAGLAGRKLAEGKGIRCARVLPGCVSIAYTVLVHRCKPTVMFYVMRNGLTSPHEFVLHQSFGHRPANADCHIFGIVHRGTQHSRCCVSWLVQVRHGIEIVVRRHRCVQTYLVRYDTDTCTEFCTDVLIEFVFVCGCMV